MGACEDGASVRDVMEESKCRDEVWRCMSDKGNGRGRRALPIHDDPCTHGSAFPLLQPLLYCTTARNPAQLSHPAVFLLALYYAKSALLFCSCTHMVEALAKVKGINWLSM